MFQGSLLAAHTQLQQRSYYEASVQRGPVWAPLQGTAQADVLVVGAGYAGLSAAIELAQRGLRVVVLEAERVCAGASGRNGGQTIVGFACGQDTLEHQLGRADARLAWDMSLQALDLIDQRIAHYAIDCDRVAGYVYVADSARKARALRNELDTLQRNYGLDCEVVGGVDVQRFVGSSRYVAAAYEHRSGHLHPLKYGLGLANAAQALGVTLHEHTPVQVLNSTPLGVYAHTPQGQVRARYAVVAGNCTLASHGPGVLPQIHARIMPVGTYIVATAPLSPLLCQQLIAHGAAVCDNNVVLDYFRCSADHRLLFGGRVSYTASTPARLQALMQQRLVAIFPALAQVPIDYVWGGFVDISMNRAPDFGRVGKHIYYLQGFSGHGVALAGLAGQLVAQALTGQAERFDVFARLQHRPFPGGAALRTPVLALGMLWHRLRDALG